MKKLSLTYWLIFLSTTFTVVLMLLTCFPSEDSPEQIIGTPIKIGNLEVAQNDFPKGMAWIEAKNACANLGSGWRLPTQDELDYLYDCYRYDEIGGFTESRYWTSNRDDTYYIWVKDFVSGENTFGLISYDQSVRAVRSF